MEQENRFKAKPAKVLICYLFLLTAATVLCCQSEVFLLSARDIKPYSVLFTHSVYRGLEGDILSKVIYFGNSSMYYPPEDKEYWNDSSQYTSTFLQDILLEKTPHERVGVASWPVPSFSMYHYYCLFYRASELSPDLLIIPIDWISFGYFWNHLDDLRELCAFVPLFDEFQSDVENPIRTKGISRVRQLAYKFEILLVYPMGFRRFARERLDSAIGDHFFKWEDDAGERWRSAERDKLISEEQHLRKSYPMRITTKHEAYRYIRALSNAGSNKRIKILFYLSPVNLKYLEMKGAMDREAFEASKKTIASAAQGPGIFYVDLSELLDGEDFHDMAGHYSVKGRKKIAEALAPLVMEILTTDKPNPALVQETKQPTE